MPAVLHLSYSRGLRRLGLPRRSSFLQWIEAGLRGCKHSKPAEISLRLVDEDEGYTLNSQYRQKKYATNVLSFSTDFPAEVTSPLLGDLVLCASVVQREAKEQKKTLRHHYAHLTIHGVLHLLGYDHETEQDAEQMETLERKILASLGIPDPYCN